MTEAAETLTGLAPLGAVLHIGAGTGRDVPAYLAAGARQILLAEPEPRCQPALAALARGHAAVQLVAAAATPAPGPETGQLHRFSFSSLNSLQAPAEALQELFPGLRQLDPEQVALRPVAELAAELDLDQPGAHVLVLEAPGMALELLEALAAEGVLEKFRLIRVQDGRSPLFSGASGIAAVQAFLEQAGFDGKVRVSGSDPEWPMLEAEAGTGLRTRVPLRQHRALQERLDGLEADRDAALARVAWLQQEAGGRETEIQRQAQALNEAAAARSRAEDDVRKLAARVAELETENRRQAQDLEDAASARSAAAAEAEKLAARMAELEAGKTAGAEVLKAAEDKAVAAESEARQAQQNLAVALRLQSRSEADLKELQKRYGALLQRQEAQEDLLRRTGACLGYLMDDSAPEEARPVLAAAVALRSGGGA